MTGSFKTRWWLSLKSLIFKGLGFKAQWCSTAPVDGEREMVLLTVARFGIYGGGFGMVNLIDLATTSVLPSPSALRWAAAFHDPCSRCTRVASANIYSLS